MLWILKLFSNACGYKTEGKHQFPHSVVKTKYYNTSSEILVVGANITWTLHDPPLGPNVIISEEGETLRTDDC